MSDATTPDETPAPVVDAQRTDERVILLNVSGRDVLVHPAARPSAELVQVDGDVEVDAWAVESLTAGDDPVFRKTTRTHLRGVETKEQS